MIPIQIPKTYLLGIEATRSTLGKLNASVRDPFLQFWADPIGQIDALESQAAVCGMTLLEVFASHQATIQFLAAVAPELLTWFAGVPIEVPFLPDGGVDRELLAERWAAYLESIPPIALTPQD